MLGSSERSLHSAPPPSRCEYKILTKSAAPFPPSYSRSRWVGGRCQRRRQRTTTTAAAAAGAAAASDDGGVFFFKPQRSASLNKYSGGDGREAAPRGQIVGGIERERCVEGRRLRAICGGGGGRGDWWRRRIRSIFISGRAKIYLLASLIYLLATLRYPLASLIYPLATP